MDDPSAPPTTGDTNFANGILIITIVLTALSAIAGGFRFAIRTWIVDGLGWDDYTIMFAIVRP